MMQCRTCGAEMRMISCPDGRPGCMVAHFGCVRCTAVREKERAEREQLEALQQANGLLQSSAPRKE